jgi:DNA helicase-4
MKEQNKIDFADMINISTKNLDELKSKNIRLPYKYIIIDEFQDIAKQRFNLTKKLSEVTNAKVVAVGDDWQSIYAFAGSDVTLFTRFLELMGSGKEMLITHTYRNSQELIDVAGGFVQKNTAQIKKRLISPKHLVNPICIDVYNDSYQLMLNQAKCVTEIIGKIITEFGEQSSILILGRYGFEKDHLIKTQSFVELPNNKILSKTYPKANISFMTAHSSKGLGYDNVIVLNMQEGKFGFPCQLEDDPIMKLVRVEDTNIEYAEERRLFYVALTRTKNRVYIVAPENKPSRFLLEIIRDYNLAIDKEINMNIIKPDILRCPICKSPLKREYNKTYGLTLYVCTNEPEICDFMTNSKEKLSDIFKCPKCNDGYMIVRKNREEGVSSRKQQFTSISLILVIQLLFINT